MTNAPVKNRAVVPITAVGDTMGVAIVAATSVLNRQGKKR
jgi:hypothetical protein